MPWSRARSCRQARSESSVSVTAGSLR
jgi:hypothetical protein